MHLKTFISLGAVVGLVLASSVQADVPMNLMSYPNADITVDGNASDWNLPQFGSVALETLALESPHSRRALSAYKPGRFALKVISEEGSRRVIRFTFELAETRRRDGRAGRLTCCSRTTIREAV